ncbi:unnamed protein product [Effrenium voratum]|uniref:Uncharacterized protein n=1 Tax=Effrenium voratum TaxID=2562239 RepID=A0AA36HPV1_9DINO|nr:unnamed protein product [Effrenium voratum]CAJ1373114.1 unnamed protein product [Effrenium voratum]CAJ1427786.1 unnamed protein product [Effrenium voratum]
MSSRALAVKASKISGVSSSGTKSRRTTTRKGTNDSGFGDGSKASSSVEDYHVNREGHNASDKFIVGVIGATLMIVQVVVLIAGLTSWLKVVNTELVEELRKAGIDNA